MPDILHTLTIGAAPAAVFAALTEREGLAAWWSEQTTAETGDGGRLIVDFGERYHNAMTITAWDPPRRLAWRVDEAHPEWVGTRVTFDLEPAGGRTMLRFGHRGWREATDFLGSCNYQWAHYLRSLKSYCETGAGEPWRAPPT